MNSHFLPIHPSQVVSTDPAHSLGDALMLPLTGDATPVPGCDGLDAMEVRSLGPLQFAPFPRANTPRLTLHHAHPLAIPSLSLASSLRNPPLNAPLQQIDSEAALKKLTDALAAFDLSGAPKLHAICRCPLHRAAARSARCSLVCVLDACAFFAWHTYTVFRVCCGLCAACVRRVRRVRPV